MDKFIEKKNRQLELEMLLIELRTLLKNDSVKLKGVAKAIDCSSNFLSLVFSGARVPGVDLHNKLKFYIEEEKEKSRRFRRRVKEYCEKKEKNVGSDIERIKELEKKIKESNLKNSDDF